MFICGCNFVGGNLSYAMTPTETENTNYIEANDCMCDYLYASKDTSFELTETPPSEWTFDTALYATFENDNTNAGNVDWNLKTVSNLVLKVREKGEFEWKPLYTKEIHTIDDFKVEFNDYLNKSGAEYEYAIVQVLQGAEGSYNVSEVESKFDGIFIIEGGKAYHSPITNAFVDTTRNMPSSNVELLNRRYPVYVRNTIANYDTGQCEAQFVPIDDSGCFTDDFYNPSNKGATYKTVKYQKEVMDMLTDGLPKILKVMDGRSWIINVTENPTDSADTMYNNRQISFSWVEIGSDSVEDLYYLGLSNVSEEWW